MAWYLFQLLAHMLLLQWSGQEWRRELPVFLEYSQSLCSTPTSYLAFAPILPAWPISVLLKYMIDRIQIILPHYEPLKILHGLVILMPDR